MEAKEQELVRRIEEKMGRPIFTEQGKEDSLWMSEHAQELVDRYTGKWVAVYKGEVVAVGGSFQEVVELAKERKGPDCTPVTEFVISGKYVYQSSSCYQTARAGIFRHTLGDSNGGKAGYSRYRSTTGPSASQCLETVCG